MRVKFNANIFVRGQTFKQGEIYDIDDELTDWLKGLYEVVETEKEVEEPPKDKMVKTSKKKEM